MKPYERFVQETQQGKLASTYLLLGTEDLLKQEGITLLTEQVLSPSSRDFNLDRFYGPDADPAAVVNAALSFPALAPKRLVILRDLDKVAEKGLRVLLPLFERPPETTCLVLTAQKVDGRKKTFSTLAKHCVTVACNPLYDNQVSGWIRRRFGRAGKRIAPQATDLLLVQVGTSLGELANEIEKLLIFVGDRPAVEASDVREVVGISKVNTVFELADAIGRKQLPRAVRTLGRMLEEGGRPTVMVAMILRHLAIILKIQAYRKRNLGSQELSRRLGVSPHFLKQYEAQSAGFTTQMLIEGIEHLREAESDLKRGYQSDRAVLELLIYRLCGLSSSGAVFLHDASGSPPLGGQPGDGEKA